MLFRSKRALRCGKLTLAALDAVLRLYGDPDRLVQRLPTLRLLARPAAEIEALARRLQPGVAAWWAAECTAGWATALRDGPAAAAAAAAGAGVMPGGVEVVPVFSQIGSGALPVDRLPSHALRFTLPGAKRHAGRALEALAARLRALPVPVIGRISDGALQLDLRCLVDEVGFAALFAAPQRPASLLPTSDSTRR